MEGRENRLICVGSPEFAKGIEVVQWVLEIESACGGFSAGQVVCFLAGLQAVAQDEQTAARDAATGLEQIVVTAERREEPVQDVPMSVIALTGQDLEQSRITTIPDLQFFVPGLRMPVSSNTRKATR